MNVAVVVAGQQGPLSASSGSRGSANLGQLYGLLLAPATTLKVQQRAAPSLHLIGAAPRSAQRSKTRTRRSNELMPQIVDGQRLQEKKKEPLDTRSKVRSDTQEPL